MGRRGREEWGIYIPAGLRDVCRARIWTLGSSIEEAVRAYVDADSMPTRVGKAKGTTSASIT